MKKIIGWYASGDNLINCGPFKTQEEAWWSMRLTSKAALKEGCPFFRDTLIYPKFEDDENEMVLGN